MNMMPMKICPTLFLCFTFDILRFWNFAQSRFRISPYRFTEPIIENLQQIRMCRNPRLKMMALQTKNYINFLQIFGDIEIIFLEDCICICFDQFIEIFGCQASWLSIFFEMDFLFFFICFFMLQDNLFKTVNCL